jgi:hypothetical protein
MLELFGSHVHCAVGRDVRSQRKAGTKICRGLLAVLLLASPRGAKAYDFPLSESAIRDAYFLGTRQTSLGPDFLAKYTREIPKLTLGSYRSSASLETPFTQVAILSSKKLNYSAQDAVKEFLGKPLVFRIHLEICYMLDAPPDGLQVRIVQKKKDLMPDSSERALFFPASDKYSGPPPSIGETIDLVFSPDKIDSSTLSILIDAPDGQHADAEFNLQVLR